MSCNDLGQQHEHTRSINHFLLHRAMPVDIRHNAKIFREKLAAWARRKLADSVLAALTSA